MAKVYTQNPEAYQLYMQGQFHVFKLVPDEVNKGIVNFQKAIELDPNYAMAYTGLATAYRSLALGAQISPAENLQKSAVVAQKAIDLDPGLAEGHTALATSLMWGRWEWAKAEAEYVRAIDLDPSSGITHIFYAQLLSCTGRHTEALAEAKRANEIEPLWPFAGSIQGLVISNSGQTDEAIAKLRQTYDLDPGLWMPHLFMTSALINKGLYDEAVVEARKTSELGPAQSQQIGYECYALAKSGRRDEALAVLNGLTKRSSIRYTPPYHFALSYMGLGDRENALASLETAYAEHDPMMVFLKVETKWQDLRSEPRFIELMKKMNFNDQ
jgi:serine/threonine-protein kinase